MVRLPAAQGGPPSARAVLADEGALLTEQPAMPAAPTTSTTTAPSRTPEARRLTASGCPEGLSDHSPVSAIAPVLRVTVTRRTASIVAAGALVVALGVVGLQHLQGTASTADQRATAAMTVLVPNMDGFPAAEASRILRQQGFRVAIAPVHANGYGVNPRHLPRVGNVIRQAPASGVLAPTGAVVRLFVFAG